MSCNGHTSASANKAKQFPTLCVQNQGGHDVFFTKYEEVHAVLARDWSP